MNSFMKMTVKEKELISSQDAHIMPSSIQLYEAAALDTKCSQE